MPTISNSLIIAEADLIEPIHPGESLMDDFIEALRDHAEQGRGVRCSATPSFRLENEWEWAFRSFNWHGRGLGESEPVSAREVRLLDLIGSSHTEVFSAQDLTMWMEFSLKVAHDSEIRRDEELGRGHSRL